MTTSLQAAFRTDAGRVRTNNEDVPLVDADRGVYGVIDGVGGHAAGELAAAIACDVIMQRLARPLGTPAERVREAIAIANNEIFRRAEGSAELHGMTCVITLAVVADGSMTIGHVGDSRLYKLRANGIQKLTHDHSPVGEREDAQEMTEVEAMRHPRRHEVFRDVGSAYRDKDEEDYVEVIEEPIEHDCAILLCTDGLTDMVPSPTIERLVKQHAGRPEAVVDALITAANDAGGRDNVTVVYAEAPEFARVVRGKRPNPGPPAAAVAGTTAATNGARDADATVVVRPEQVQTAPEPRTNRLVGLGRWIVRSRTTWFALGALAGVLAALVLIWRVPWLNVGGNRTLTVGVDGTGTFSRISDAMLTARPGDVVRLEPGVYRERVFLANGVSLVARLPNTVTLARAPAANVEWVAIMTFGDLGGRISGIRIESTPEVPVDVGIRVWGQSRTIELVELAGPMRAGIELMPAAAVTLQGSHMAVQGPALTIADRSQALVTGNVFLRVGRTALPPVSIAASAQTTVRRNLFAGYGTDIVKGASALERQQIVVGNVIVTAEPSPIR